MSVSDDVGNLFRRFGGDAGQYQEVARDDEAKQAALRWPLLNALDIAHAKPVPDAGRPALASSGWRAEPAIAPSAARNEQAAAQTAQAAAGDESTGPARLPLFARGHRHATMPPPVAPAQTGANRFSAPPAVASATTHTAGHSHAAANAPTISAAPAAGMPKPAVAATPSMPRREAQPIPAPPFLSERQTFAPAPFSSPLADNPRATFSVQAQQQGGSILSGLFGAKQAAPVEAPSAAPSKDLPTLFARLSRGHAAPARSLRDTLRSRFKADGDA
jgi:hypothetical protein